MPDDAAPRLTLRVDFPGGGRIGPGKVALIEAVGRTGSISAAGRSLGMSYRRAWLLLDALNRMFDTPVVVAASGGAGGGGAQVTAFGERLVCAYRALERETEARAAAMFADACAHLPAAPADPAGGDG